MGTYLSVQHVKIPSWTCLYPDLSWEVITLFRKRELVLMLVHLGNSLFTFLWQAEISLWQFSNAEVHLLSCKRRQCGKSNFEGNYGVY